MVNSDQGSCISVNIVFLRPASVICHILILLRNRHLHTDPCDIADCSVVCRRKLICHNDIPVCINRIINALRRIQRCDRARRMDRDHLILCVNRKFLYREIICRIFHFLCKVRVIAHPCAEIIRLRAFREKRIAVHCIVGDITCALVKCYRELISSVCSDHCISIIRIFRCDGRVFTHLDRRTRHDRIIVQFKLLISNLVTLMA